MTVAARPSNKLLIASDGVSFTSNFNAELIAPGVNNASSNAIFALNKPNAFAFFKMFNFNKIYNKVVSVFLHNNNSFKYVTCTGIAEVKYTGYVYNLSIEEDETYIVNGIVTHNCRSTITPVFNDEL